MPSPASSGLVVGRISEIFLKGGNRRMFFGRLVGNARALLAAIDGATVEPRHLQIVVRYPEERRSLVLERLGRLFGLHTLSPAVRVERDLEAIAVAAIELASAWAPGTRWKVETNRRDKSFPMRSPQVSAQVGARVAAAHPELVVDVRDPEVTVNVEIGGDDAFVFGESIPGPGGLPVGTGGKVGLLLSGGIDSPVAGWSAMRRGCRVHGIYFHSFPYTGDKTREKVVELARLLSRWQGRTPLSIVHFTDVQKKLREHGPGDLAVLLYRRMMMRAATLIAERHGARGLVTGENLGQVASQTLENLGVIEHAAGLPVLRPLLCLDKAEIVDRAKAIGTYETSILPYDDCCSLFVPKHPATRARIGDLIAAEDGLDVAAMAEELAEGAERVDVD
jgi:thiamine biosynthesis protein ThiI